MGIDLAEFHKFNFNLKTGVDFEKFYQEGDIPSDEFITELLNVFVSLKSYGNNIKYLIGALIAALKDVKLKNEKYQKKLEKILGFANLINTYISGTVKFEYDANVIKGEIEKNVENIQGGKDGFKIQVHVFNEQAIKVVQQMVRPILDGMGLTSTIKSLNLDNISFSIGVPKYQHGLALVLKFPGLTYVLEELLK